MSQAVELLSELVRRPSQNPMGRPISEPDYYESAVTDFLEGLFRSWGVRYERQPVTARRDNIVAYLPGSASQPTYVWEAHQDTVPALGMTVEPFAAHIENGRLYGRGACDVKGGLAAMLAAFHQLLNEPIERRCSIILACIVDEEYTFTGIRAFTSQPIRAEGAIVAEPTQLRIITAHKGIVRWRIHTHGRSCHSSQPEAGVNAIYRMARVVSAIENYAAWLSSHRRHNTLGPATLSVGRIEGGISANIVPERCTIELDRRILPDEDVESVPDELAGYLLQHLGPESWDQEKPWMVLPPLDAEGKDKLVARLRQAAEQVIGWAETGSVAYGTDASTLQAAGIPCVVFGPGDIAQAHTADEWIELRQVEQAADILYRFALIR
ncbi:MAG: M20 family metallopeptidase [Gemmatales bacterium]|nr:M20 family metallopeptidase [Gemmatales bacterium]MCS7159411.1 M20 family metallopeptidase [Gemmatales bacterium]MDW8174610.1 M20 family metallopeptidase [Gemmatales bacterium]MDW8222752.1 M20 family metallopeptidase [Gemmatales bacterium]